MTIIGLESGLGIRAALRLASVHEAAEKHARAVDVLEEASRTLVAHNAFGWMQHLQARDRLSGLYRRTGRIAEADVIDADLRQFLAPAPDDHPIKRQLAARRSASLF